jgi:hypothetical protein
LINTDNANFGLAFRNSSSSNKLWDISSFNNDLVVNEGGIAARMYFKAGGGIGIGTTTPTNSLEVVGTGKFTGQLTLGSTITNGTFTYTLPGATGTLALTTDIPSLTANAPLSYVAGVLSISQANTSTNGYLSSTDWNTFNNKQIAGDYITALTGEATATGPGSAAITLSNSAVIGKVLTGLSITGGTIGSTDSILTAFGKVQNQINSLVGGVNYQGTWNASTNTPALTSSVGTKGFYYVVSVAGSTNLNGITDWKIGDWAIYDGTAWQKVDNTDTLTSVGITSSAAALSISNSPLTANGNIGVNFSGTSTQYVAGDGTLVAFPTLTGYVPYTGATSNVNLGTHSLTAYDLIINHSSGSGVAASITKGGSGEALTVTKSSGSGNAASITGGVTLLETLHLTNALTDTYISSAATWNAKQDAITLTTTGTSGAATFSGGTLNIPNYGSALSGYVPYTGATNSVNLGSYGLTASSLESTTTITSSSNVQVGGTLLLSTSGGASIQSGYTTIIGKTAGIGIAQGNSAISYLTFPTSTSSAYTYTFPAADGTIALTSNLNGYVPYTGATASLDMGIYDLKTSNIVYSNSVWCNQMGGGDIATGATTFSMLGSDIIFATGTEGVGSWTEKMRLKADGNFGIGNAAPSYKLDVSGTGRFTGALTGTSATFTNTSGETLVLSKGTGPSIQFNKSNSTAQNWAIATDPNFNIYNYTLGGTPFSINAATNAATFSSSIKATGATIKNPASDGSTPVISIRDTSDVYEVAYLNFNQSTDMMTLMNKQGYSASGIAFGTDNTERMRISQSGNVGIGTTSPQGSYMLTVCGDSSSKTGGITFRQTSTDTFYMGNPSVTNTTDFELWNPRDGYTRFATNNTERMRITSTGNVGIGVTSPNARLEIREANKVFDAYGNVNVFTTDTGSQNVGGSIALGGDSFGGTTPYPFAKIQGIKEGASAWSGALILGTTQSNSAIIERMRITSSGALKVSNTGGYFGVSSPYNEFRQGVTDTNVMICTNTSASPYGTYMYFTGASPNNTTNYFYAAGDYLSDRLLIWSNGSVVNKTGSYGTISDRKYKENIVDATPKLDDLMQLKVRNFNMIGDEIKQIGFIAQEFEEVFPNMIDTSIDKNTKEEYKSIKTSVLIPMLVKAIQELKAEIDELKNK